MRGRDDLDECPAGRHVHVNPNATIGHDAVLGDFVSVNPAAVVSGAVVVGAGTLLGAASTILQNLTVGECTLIGAGSVVTKDVPDGVVVTGVPGRWRGPASVLVEGSSLGQRGDTS